MSDLRSFVAAAELDCVLQQQLNAAPSPAAIVELAEEQGFLIAIKELRAASRDLCAPWWPWTEKGRAWRRAFFEGPSQP